MSVPAYATVSMTLQLVGCVAPLCLCIPRRKRAGLRAVAATLLILLAEIVQDPARQVAISTNDQLALLLTGFAVTLAELFVAVLIVCDASPWQALFCSASSYIAQNLISGTGSLIHVFEHAGAIPALPSQAPLIVGVALVYPIYLCFFVRTIRKNGLAGVSDPQMILVAAMVVVAVIGLDVAIKKVPEQVVGLQTIVFMRVGHGALCAFTLYAEVTILNRRRLATEREVERRMAAERERQYTLSRQNIDAINIKCHDIKHQIRSLADGGAAADPQALEDLAREVSIYDSAVQTGNTALDTILTEKTLACTSKDITLATIADGHALDFLEPQEIYAFFGNALDNAIEASGQLEDPSSRYISLNVRREGAMAVIEVENRCAATPEFCDGLPVSTKGDASRHGFGTQSMRRLVEARGGTLVMGAEEDVFYVSALLPIRA